MMLCLLVFFGTVSTFLFNKLEEECSSNGAGHNDMREELINWKGEEMR